MCGRITGQDQEHGKEAVEVKLFLLVDVMTIKLLQILQYVN